MPGPGYYGEAHKRLTGDPNEVARWVPVARKVLGFAIEQAKYNGLMTHKVTQRLENGVVLIGELVGGLPRYSVEVPPNPQPEQPKPKLDDFVVWARNEDNLVGIDPEFMAQILRWQERNGYKTFFYDSGIQGYDDFPGKKGTYVEMFPDGVKHAGNIDWMSKREEVISWYGPSSRYWPDAYVQPRYQFGQQVFMLGAVLLDIPQYEADSPEQDHGPDKWILGAALKKTDDGYWLYVVQSEALDEDRGTGPYDITATPDVGCPYAKQNNAGGIYRYALVREADEVGTQRYRVVNESRELLAELPDNHAEPWFFNQSCTLAHCYVLDPGGWFYRKYYQDEAPGAFPPMSPVLPIQLPNASQTFREAVFDDAGGCEITDTSLTVQQSPPSPQHFVADYKGDRRVYGYITDYSRTLFAGFTDSQGYIPGHGPVLFSLCGTDVANVNTSFFPGSTPMSVRFPNPEPFSSFYFMFADLRTDVMVLRTTYTIVGVPMRWRQSTEVYQGGVQRFATEEASRRLATPAVLQYGTIGFPTFMNPPGSPGERSTWPPYFYLFGVMIHPAFSGLPGPFRWIVSGGVAGFSPGFLWTPYPSAAYFGFLPSQSPYGGAVFWDDNLLSLSIASVAGFNSNSTDFDGHFHVLSCASRDDRVAVSGYLCRNDNDPERPPDPPIYNGDHSFSYITDSTMEELTGIGGEYPRYHPVWRLGKPPLSP